jgi:hypothetical protein
LYPTQIQKIAPKVNKSKKFSAVPAMKDLTKTTTHDDSAEFLCGNMIEKNNRVESPGSWKELYQRSLKLGIHPTPVQKITVHVETPNDEVFTLTGIHPMDTIGKIKQRLSTKVDIPTAQQTLLLDGTKLAKNTMTIKETKIKNGCTLELQRMMVFVKISKDKVVKVPTEADMPLWEVQLYLEEKHGIDEDELLGYNGLVLDEPERTLAEYRIRGNAELVVIDRC